MPNNPDLRPTVDLGKFRFWCQKVLPLVYDDSISYYEVLGKMVVYLNQVIDNVNADTENVLTLKQAFDELEAYVAEAIQYDIHDLEEAVASAIHSAEMASESATLANGYAESAEQDAQSASGSASDALGYAQQASGSAVNASNSALNALEAQQQASGYATSANNSAINAANSALNAVSMADQSSAYCQRAETAASSAEEDAASADADADNAEENALKSEGHAVGKQNGVDVDSSSPYYHNNAKYYAEQAGQGAGVVSLDSLTNVDIQNPADGQALVYDSTSEKWINSDEAIGVTSLDALTDTDINSASSGQVLMYDGTNQKWVNSAEKEVAIAQNPPSDPATKIWIDSNSPQTPYEIYTKPELDVELGNINDNIADIYTQLTGKANSVDVVSGLASKENKTTVINQVAPSSLTVTDNYEYYLTNVSSLTIAYPESGNFECWIYIETASSGSITITLPTSSYIGDQPVFDTGEKWEISIKNGVVIAGKIE